MSALPESALATCVVCGDGIDADDRNALREVLGFAKDRKAGGQNHVMFRQETGRWMCGRCALLHKHNANPDQHSLLQ